MQNSPVVVANNLFSLRVSCGADGAVTNTNTHTGNTNFSRQICPLLMTSSLHAGLKVADVRKPALGTEMARFLTWLHSDTHMHTSMNTQ